MVRVEAPAMRRPWAPRGREGVRSMAASRATCRPRRARAGATDSDRTSTTSSSTHDNTPSTSSSVSSRVTLLGGKGGVGKTTMAASFAVGEAKRTDLPTLVVSTDPAHSLSDALGQDVSGGVPVQVDSYSSLPLWALEVDPNRAKEEIASGAREAKEKAEASGSSPLSSVAGLLKLVGVDLDPTVFENLNLGDLLASPPPGFDEVLAVAKIMDFVDSDSDDGDSAVAMPGGGTGGPHRFANVVIDTAPTGHTLRLLAAPELLDRSLGKALAVKRMLDGASSLVKSVLSFGQAPSSAEGGEPSLTDKIESARRRLRAFGRLLKDAEATEFVAVTIPTQMAVSETIALASTLKREGIPIRRCVVNQVLPKDAADGGLKLIETRQKDQERAIEMLEGDPSLASLEQLRSPFLDLEVKGVPALQYFGRGLWQGSSTLADAASERDQRFVIVGGKGGVGKTTTSASLALQYAEQGHEVLLVSTDPAHSLGDSVAQDVSGGEPVRLQGTDLPVHAMEIDPEEAMAKLRAALSEAEASAESVGGGEGASSSTDAKVDLGNILRKVQELKLGELLEDPPPGTDEAIAVAKVVQFAEKPEYQRFTRVVIDTAPTGHTLRLLTLPAFVSLSVDKILKFRGVIAQVAGAAKGDAAIAKLEDLRRQMDAVQALFRDKSKTEFVIVGIPTYLSVAESGRLASALAEEDVFVRHVVVNQILDFGGGAEEEDKIKAFVKSRMREQEQALARLEGDDATSSLEIREAPVINMEVRGVPALEYFSSLVWDRD